MSAARRNAEHDANRRAVEAEPVDDDGTLGPCGCTDYHLADCPVRTSRLDALYAGEDEAERFYAAEDRF